jgi:hypothetical protein
MKKFLIKCVCLGMLSMIFFGLIAWSMSLWAPHYYDGSLSYQKGFVLQYRALQKATPSVPKVVVIGGSYMTFSVDSDLLATLSHKPCYTLGINSSMGMAYIFDTVEKCVNPGDTVIYAFRQEKNLSDYGMDTIWLSVAGESDMVYDLVRTHPGDVLRSSGSMVFKKLYAVTVGGLIMRVRANLGDALDPAYNITSFSKSGNFVYHRDVPENSRYSEKMLRRMQESITGGRIHLERPYINRADLDCIHGFLRRMSEKNVNVRFVYGPVYKKALVAKDEDVKAFEAFIKTEIPAAKDLNVADSLYDYDCFYNNCLHLNSKGAQLYTKNIYDTLLK